MTSLATTECLSQWDTRRYRIVFYLTMLALLVVFIGDSPYYQSTQARVQSGTHNVVRQMLLLGFLLFAITPAILRPKLITEHLHDSWPVFIAGLLVMASISWSHFPGLSVIRILSFEIMLVSAFWITVLNPPDDRLTVWYGSLIGIILVDAISFLLVPDWTLDQEGRFKGIHSHKNELGVIMSIAVFVAIDRWHRYRSALSVLVTLAALTMLLASASKTSIVLTLLLAPLLTILQLDRRHSFNAALVLGTTLVSVITLFFLADALGLFGASFDDLWRAETFTNRTVLWEYARHKISQHPLLGYGFGGFWGTDPIRALAFHDANSFVRQFGQAHNGYLGIALELGLTGLLFWIGVLTIATVKSINQLRSDRPEAPLLFILLIYCLFHNMFERSFFVTMSPLWFVLIFTLIHLFQSRKTST